MRASGQSGELRAGYQVAARLGSWRMEQAARLPVAYEFSAEIRAEHAHWIAQQPLDLVLALGKVEWTWRAVSFVREGNRVVIELQTRPEVLERAPVHVRKGQQR